MISPSIARAVCGGREGGGIELDHFSYSQVQIIYYNESLLILYDPTKRSFSLNSEISGASMSCCWSKIQKFVIRWHYRYPW